MKQLTKLAIERKFRPLVRFIPPEIAVKIYSRERINFLKKVSAEVPGDYVKVPADIEKVLWGLRFRSPIMNAAGMFKNCEGFDMVARQGAGAYLGGTGTFNPRNGNTVSGVYLPFVVYPSSEAASNKLGLPNDGDALNSERAKDNVGKRIKRMPIGHSVMRSPDFSEETGMEKLIEGMWLYYNAGVDFLEINESCPNAHSPEGKEAFNNLKRRLQYVRNRFLDKREKSCPVIVKLSNDTEPEDVQGVMDLFFELGYDGVNFGNTSTRYDLRKKRIDPRERKLFEYFTKKFEGGVSGKPLRESSLELVLRAANYLKNGPPKQEFHIIRTGGISSSQDVVESLSAGASLVQWFTGYWERFAEHGHDLYKEMYKDLSRAKL